MNLLTNAAKYTPQGGHVLLEATREGTEAVIRVRDDGVGIPADMLDAVFDLFVQSSRTIERAQGGIGVGPDARAVADRDARRHDRRATSDGEGKGSTFDGAPPAQHQARRRAHRARSSGRPVVHRARGSSSSRTTTTAARCCARCSRAPGSTCKTAADGLAALELIDEFEPQAAVVDVGLPGIDGFEVARRIRANPAASHR